MGLELNELHDLSRILKTQNANADAAVCQLSDGRVYYGIYSSGGKEPYSAATVLTQGMLQEVKTGFRPQDLQSEQVTVVTTYTPNEMDQGMMAMVTKNMGRLAAYPESRAFTFENGNAALKKLAIKPKRVSFDWNRDHLTRFACRAMIPSPQLDLGSADTTSHSGYHTVHRIYLMATYALLNLHNVDSVDGKYVAALMVSRTGKILAYGLNTNKENKTLHAEVNMLQSYYKFTKATNTSGIPPGARIYTTLQPCKMCAGMIVATAKNRDSTHVYYGMTDPTQKADSTALSVNKMETLLSGEKGAAVRGIKTGQGDLAKHLDTDYKQKKMARAAGDAASYGASVDYKGVTTELSSKYQRNVSPTGGKVVNPNVLKALEHVRMFLNHLGLTHQGEALVA